MDTIAQKLFKAARGAKALVRFTAANPKFSLGAGYQVQEELQGLHLADGEKLVGYKMGMTSKAKMEQMGLKDPIRGFLTDRMEIKHGGAFSLAGHIHPKAEPEIAFILKSDLKGAPSLEEALASVGEVCVALEIIDSRYENFDFQLPDVVADNCSSSGFVLGSVRKKVSQLDLANIPMEMKIDGKTHQSGNSSAILGHPGRSLAELARMLDERGQFLPKGAIVLAGGATAAVRLEAGTKVSVETQGLGTAEFTVTK